MAQSQSKMIQEESYEEEVNWQNKLVLYIEEIDSDNKSPDMRCFIIYDDGEKEYLISGMRREGFVTGEQHKFYCKKRINLLNYLKSIFDPKNEVNIILYNYINYPPYKENELTQLNFKQLHLLTNKKKEIVGYDGVKLTDYSSWNYITMHLKNLEFVRY